MKINIWFKIWIEIYNPLCSAEILNCIKGVSCEREHLDLYINDKCVTQPDLNLASEAFGSSCCGKMSVLKDIEVKFRMQKSKSSLITGQEDQADQSGKEKSLMGGMEKPPVCPHFLGTAFLHHHRTQEPEHHLAGWLRKASSRKGQLILQLSDAF